MRRTSAVCICLFILLAFQRTQAHSLDDAELVFAGLWVNGGEAGEVDGYRQDEEFWLPLVLLQEKLGFRSKRIAGKLRLITPIGEAELPFEETGRIEQKPYLSITQLDQYLKIRTSFDASAWAFRLQVPWRPGGSPVKARAATAHLEPDIPAPDTSLGFLRWRTDYSRFMDSGEHQWLNTLDTGGALGEGSWLLGLKYQNDDEVRLERYFWNRVFQHNALRLGTSYADMGILLDSFYYTGLQWAWSSDHISRYTDFETDLNFDSFLREDIEAQRDIIRNDGPPGGIAELRVDGRPVARERVSLNGHYEFRDIPWRQGAFQTTQVYLYPRSLSDDPRIVDFTRTSLGQVLSAGEWLLRGGLGESGNVLYDDYGSPQEGEPAGFFLARYGFNEWLTGQWVLQQNETGIAQLMGGLRMSLGSRWALTFDLALRNGRLGFSSELQGWAAHWDLQARSRYYQQDYRSNFLDSEYDHYLRTFFRWNDNLRIGLVGRLAQDSRREDVRFLLPGAYWRPLVPVSLSAIPNLDGDYRVQGDWFASAGSRGGFVYENDLYTLTWDQQFDNGLHGQLGADYQQQEQDQRVFVRADWYIDENQYNYLQAGVSYSGETAGYFLSWNRIFTPGVELEVQYLDDYRIVSGYDGEPQLQVLLRIDLAGAGGRLAPSDNRRINFTRGGISGFIRDSDGRRLDVDDVVIRVNGRRLPQYQASGAFSVANLKPGLYEVELDEGQLPIEYVPEKQRYLAEVGRAAITEVNFVVRREYGVAGRVVDGKERAVQSAWVQLLDKDDKVIGEGRSGRFGYYRVDGVAPGNYRLMVVRIGEGKLDAPFPQIQIKITNDYIFGADLRVQTHGSASGK